MNIEIKNKEIIKFLEVNKKFDISAEDLIYSGINFIKFIAEFRENQKNAIKTLKENIKLNNSIGK
ncbi:hypothetical protein EOM09_03635 [bacterium]|nr:hypothetical protein [bacterium]